jgi:inosose dehydratase
MRLADRNLGLAGAYLEFPFADKSRLTESIADLDAMLDTFDAVSPFITGPQPRPTIADNGSPFRNANPGSGKRNPSSGHDDPTWEKFGDGLRIVVERCRSRGYEPTFHNETGTYVEAPEEVEKMLSVSDIGWCLDTGHLLLGGGDPVTALNKWFGRINHIHIKDATLSAFDKIVESNSPTTAIWDQEVFPILGQGDLNLEALVADMHNLGFQGWAVVEQDIFPKTAARFQRAVEDQRINRKILSKLGL